MSALLTLQFLAWAAERPRQYREVRLAWQSTCPLNSAYEDALAEGLVAIEDAGSGPFLRLTDAGRAALGLYRPLAAE
jgi:hypothetical protein